MTICVRPIYPGWTSRKMRDEQRKSDCVRCLCGGASCRDSEVKDKKT